MKFRFYITNTLDGMVRGTDDEGVAKDYAMSEDFFVVDAENGTWLQTDDTIQEVEAIGTVEHEPEED